MPEPGFNEASTGTNRSEPSVGKRVRGALYVHRSALAGLRAKDREVLGRVTASFTPTGWNVVRMRAGSVVLLSYPTFDVDPFPALAKAWRFDERGAMRSETDYSDRANPPILHRKETLLARADPRREGWAALTSDLVGLGAFVEPHLVGNRNQWERRLARLGIVIEEGGSILAGGGAKRDRSDA